MRMMAASGGAQGFTLVELLAAMLAGSLLLVWLGWATGSIGDEWRNSRADAPASEVAALMPNLTAIIEGAYLEETPPPAAQQTISLLTLAPEALTGTAVARTTLAVESTADGSDQLVARFNHPQSGRALAPPAILTSGWKHITLAQLPAPEKQRRAVEIGFTDSDGRRFKIRAEPRITAKAGCRFDPISLECRA